MNPTGQFHKLEATGPGRREAALPVLHDLRRQLFLLMTGLFFLLQACYGPLVVLLNSPSINLRILHISLLLGVSAWMLVFNVSRNSFWNFVTLLIAHATLLMIVSEVSVTEYVPDLLRRLFPPLLFTILGAGAAMVPRRYLMNFQWMTILASVPVQAVFLRDYLHGVTGAINFQFGFVRYAGPFEGGHTAAYFFSVVIFACTFLILKRQSGRFLRLILYADILFTIYLITLTGIRTAILLIGVFLFLLVLRLRKRSNRSLILFAILGLGTIVRYGQGFFIDVQLFLSGRVSEMQVGNGRFMLWEVNLDNFLSSSWLAKLFGRGVGTDRLINLGAGLMGSHNDYLTLLIELGALGLLLYLALFASIHLRSRRLLLPVDRDSHVWLSSLLATSLLASFFSNAFYARPYPSVYQWIMVGALLGWAGRQARVVDRPVRETSPDELELPDPIPAIAVARPADR